MATLAGVSSYCWALLARVGNTLHHYENWKSEHQYLGRYSIEKLVMFHEYQRSVSRLRVALVILLAPLPTLLVLCCMDAIQLQDPRRPVAEHYGTFIRSTLSHMVLTYAFLIAVKQALGLNNTIYSHRLILLIAVCTGLAQEAVWVAVAVTWRFPVPFRELMGVGPWVISWVTFNLLFARKVFIRYLQKLKRYLPIVSTQLVLFYLFLGLSLGFAYVPTGAQVVMILVFPLAKVVVKRFLWQYAQKLDDVSTDVTVCMVEISGSLYQTVCMQFVNSHLLGSLIMVMDFVQAVLEIRIYLRHDYMGDGRSTIQTAVKIVESATMPAADGTAHSPGLNQPRNRYERGLGSRQSSFDNRLTTDSSEIGVPTVSWWKRVVWGTSNKYEASPSAVYAYKKLSQSSIHSVALQRKMIQKRKSRQLLDLRRISPDLIQSAKLGPDSQSLSSDPVIQSEVGAVDSQSGVEVPSESTSGTGQPSQDMASDQQPGNTLHTVKKRTERHAHAPVRLLQTPLICKKRRSSYTRVLIDGVLIQRKDQARILEQTLQLLFACEVLIFVEYMEIFMPVLYGACVGSLWHLPNAKYNLLLMGMSEASMASEVLSSFAYAAAETLSFASMYWVIRTKYGVSTLHLLAFVLETYWMTLQGKLIGCFVTILNTATLHQGVDFSFRFDYDSLLS